MEKNKNREEMAALLRTLSSTDRAWLRQRLMRRDSAALLQDTGRISPRELLAVETWLWEKANVARGPREKRPRLRMWLIFMLLRYAALRLVEIFNLKPSHLDLQEGIIRVPDGDGTPGREVPLPLTVSRRLRRVLEDPALFPESQDLMRCDASYVRRCLQQCGAACGLPKGLLSARALRHSRALELGRQGLPLPVVDIFLGRRAAPGQNSIVRCDPQEARRLLREQLQREQSILVGISQNIFIQLHGMLFVATKEINLYAPNPNTLHPFHLFASRNGIVHKATRRLRSIIPIAIRIIPQIKSYSFTCSVLR